MWLWCVVSCAPLVVVFHRVHWSRGRQAFEDSGPAGGWLWSSGGALRPFCPPSCFACRVACEYGFISRFKGVFSALWGADVCLYGLRPLR